MGPVMFFVLLSTEAHLCFVQKNTPFMDFYMTISKLF